MKYSNASETGKLAGTEQTSSIFRSVILIKLVYWERLSVISCVCPIGKQFCVVCDYMFGYMAFSSHILSIKIPFIPIERIWTMMK